jgi:hypothetical protein
MHNSTTLFSPVLDLKILCIPKKKHAALYLKGLLKSGVELRRELLRFING